MVQQILVLWVVVIEVVFILYQGFKQSLTSSCTKMGLFPSHFPFSYIFFFQIKMLDWKLCLPCSVIFLAYSRYILFSFQNLFVQTHFLAISFFKTFSNVYNQTDLIHEVQITLLGVSIKHIFLLWKTFCNIECLMNFLWCNDMLSQYIWCKNQASRVWKTWALTRLAALAF